MYKSTDYEQQQISFFHFNQTCGMGLDKENEWIKSANRLPWKAWEIPYFADDDRIIGNGNQYLRDV